MVLADKSDDTIKKRLLKKPLAIVVIVSAFIIFLIVVVFIVNQKSVEPNMEFTYDILALIGKNIDQADKELGMTIGSTPEPPSNHSEPGGTKWHRIYMEDKHALVVDFNAFTRKVISFVLEGDNKEKLLEVGNLKENDARYKVEQLNDEVGMLGIKITPL